MPSIQFRNGNLIVNLSRKEQIASLRKQIVVPLSDIESVEVYEKFPRGIGLRCPGTGLPGYIQAGTYLKKGVKNFVYWRRHEVPVRIALKNNTWTSLIIGSSDAPELIERINSARQ